MSRIKHASLAFIFILTCSASGAIAGLLDREISFSEAEIQAALDKSGPQERNYGGLLNITLSEAPRITLGNGSERVGLDARLLITLLGNPPLTVSARGSAGIRYDDNTKAFMLDNPVIDQLDSRALPREAEPAARRSVNTLLGNYFKAKPIYVLRSNASPEESAARWLLRSIRVETGKVIATLAPF